MRTFLARHPMVAAALVLAAFMEGILYYAASNVALQASQYAAMAVAIVVLAGLCVWITTWE